MADLPPKKESSILSSQEQTLRLARSRGIDGMLTRNSDSTFEQRATFRQLAEQVRIPVNLNSDSGICEHHFRKVCGQGFCEQKLSFEGRHLFDSPNKPAAKRSAAVVDPGHWSMTVHLTSEFVL